MICILKTIESSIKIKKQHMSTISKLRLVKLSKLRLHDKLRNLDLENVMMDFDATSLYPFAMLDENSLSPKIETGIAFERHMNDVYVETFINQTFKQNGTESAILRIKYYKTPDRLFQHLPVKEKVKNVEVNRMRNGYIIDTLTSVNIQEVLKAGGKVIELYQGVICQENFKISSFGRGIEKLFALRQKYKDERNDLM